MNKFDYCYHSHTYRCGHATGEDEEYILTAIKAGYKEYGVTDHVLLPNIIHENMRGTYNQLDGYIKSFKNLKEKYKNEINIHIGFECEFMPEYVNYYKDLLDSHKVDYLILGQHCYYQNIFVKWYVTMEPREGLRQYTRDVIAGIESGLFTYLAHPDLFVLNYPTWDEYAEECSMKIINACIEHNMPLEINLCKYRAFYGQYIKEGYNHIYPFDQFWKLVAKTNARIVIGVDTHSPKHNIDTGFEYVEDIIKKYNLKVEYNYRIN